MGRVSVKSQTGPRKADSHKFVVVAANKKALERVRAGCEKPEKMECMQLLSPEQFVGRESGEAHILSSSKRWGGRYCPYVFIRDIEAVQTPKTKDLRARIKAEEKALKEFVSRTDISRFKAKLVTCTSCESKINKDYILNSICPVCNTSLRSKSTAASIYSKEEKIKMLRRKLSDELVKHSDEAPLRYLVFVPTD